MRNFKQRLEKLELAAAPTAAAMFIVRSRAGDDAKAMARGREVHRLKGEDYDVFVQRAVAALGPVGDLIIEVPEKDPHPGASLDAESPHAR